MDDGSTDETLCDRAQVCFGLVSVITQSNQGAASARNKAYSLCQGDYIQWLDADDILGPDKINKTAGAIAARGNPSHAGSPQRLVDSATESIGPDFLRHHFGVTSLQSNGC